jgi:hypothetical protein
MPAVGAGGVPIQLNINATGVLTPQVKSGHDLAGDARDFVNFGSLRYSLTA